MHVFVALLPVLILCTAGCSSVMQDVACTNPKGSTRDVECDRRWDNERSANEARPRCAKGDADACELAGQYDHTHGHRDAATHDRLAFACAKDRAGACNELGRLEAELGAPDAEAAFARSCQLGNSDGCMREAGFASTPAVAAPRWQRACDLDNHEGCMKLAGWLAQGDVAAQAQARTIYAGQCGRKATDACDALGRMDANGTVQR